jgi:riboflavin kinase/FMN adenylyltransferase
VPNLEVHLLDFHSDIYGKRLKVFFTRRIREEKRFSSPGELVEQIRMDISRARDAQTD